jgi:amino acid transporter
MPFLVDTVTNEQLLYVTYFGAAAFAALLAAATAFFLNRPLRKAIRTDGFGKFLARLFPSWIVLAAILGFISVNYVECKNYSEIVNDRGYIIDKTHELVYHIAFAIKLAVFVYVIIVIPHLWAAAKSLRADRKSVGRQN